MFLVGDSLKIIPDMGARDRQYLVIEVKRGSYLMLVDDDSIEEIQAAWAEAYMKLG